MLDKKEILRRLRTLRKGLALRQEFVASALGVDRTTYVRKEQGSIPITTEEWVALAAMMDVEPGHFFGAAPGAAEKTGLDSGEMQFVSLYRALAPDERADLARAISLLLKGIRRRAVRDAVDRILEDTRRGARR